MKKKRPSNLLGLNHKERCLRATDTFLFHIALLSCCKKPNVIGLQDCHDRRIILRRQTPHARRCAYTTAPSPTREHRLHLSLNHSTQLPKLCMILLNCAANRSASALTSRVPRTAVDTGCKLLRNEYGDMSLILKTKTTDSKSRAARRIGSAHTPLNRTRRHLPSPSRCPLYAAVATDSCSKLAMQSRRRSPNATWRPSARGGDSTASRTAMTSPMMMTWLWARVIAV
ncbi:MAG: hypothetical protein V7631_3352 [Massilia sp.]